MKTETLKHQRAGETRAGGEAVPDLGNRCCCHLRLPRPAGRILERAIPVGAFATGLRGDSVQPQGRRLVDLAVLRHPHTPGIRSPHTPARLQQQRDIRRIPPPKNGI